MDDAITVRTILLIKLAMIFKTKDRGKVNNGRTEDIALTL